LAEAPSNAPRPPFALGDHPIVFEVAFDATPDAFFNMDRSGKLRHEYGLLLSLFVPAIKLPKSSLANHWGIATNAAMDDAPTDFKPQWFQEFYSVDGFEAAADDYTETDMKIPLTQDADYYGRRG
jgi:hypothetical protein